MRRIARMFASLLAMVKTVYGIREEKARGRLCMTASGILNSVASQFTSGAFYTGFLLMYGFDITNIGIITFIPNIMSLLNIFSPSILERFRRRKWLLAAMRLVVYAIDILGITFLPMLVNEPRGRVLGVVALICVANGINNLFTSGYTAWHVNFLPEEVRTPYFLVHGCITNFMTYLVVLIASVLADSLAGTAHQLDFLIGIRLAAFVIALLDTALLCIPKEYPYATSGTKVHLTDIFTKPVRNKAFFYTMMILFLYSFASNLPGATINVWLLEDVGVTYSLMNGINATYFLFFLFFGKMWRMFIAKHDWFRSMAFVCVLLGLTYLGYFFVNSRNASWLYTAVRLSQHVLGIATYTITSSLPYINLPEEDRTDYLAFHLVLTNIAAFAGKMLGTLAAELMGEKTLNIFDLSFSSTPIMLFASFATFIFAAYFTCRVTPIVTPKEHYPVSR